MNEYTGEERRTDNTNIRLALLEKGQQDSERHHMENKTSLVSVHKRIGEIKIELVEQIRQSMGVIIEKLDAKEESCFIHRERTSRLEIHTTWMEKWLGATWAAIIGGAGIILKNHGK